VIWESFERWSLPSHWSTPLSAKRLESRTAVEILRRSITANPRFRQLVNSFSSLASLEGELTFLESLKTEANQGLFEEQRAAEQRAAELRAAELRAEELRAAQAESQRSQVGEGRNPSFDHAHSSNGKASWETLIISQSLRETLQAYCRILRDYTAYQEQGIHLPKGVLLFGPPGCGKTQIAKTLSAQAGLNFVALSTSDCKVGWIGHAAAKIASVFAEARAKQPTLLFIDELDAVCPPRGAYHDCISQEVTAQLLQEIDGFLSDAQAIFLVGATNRVDQIDSAVLSRFSEQIEIPLPDQTARAALLEVFLGPLRFSGDRAGAVLKLALATEGQSGRDLRALVNQAVLGAVKRTCSPEDFMLTEKDFALI
jgi:SpoVK/Ycf46/Vps4 family AAA+-type ATPase